MKNIMHEKSSGKIRYPVLLLYIEGWTSLGLAAGHSTQLIASAPKWNTMHEKSSGKNQMPSPTVILRRLDILKTGCWAFHATYCFRAKTEYYA